LNYTRKKTTLVSC